MNLKQRIIMLLIFITTLIIYLQTVTIFLNKTYNLYNDSMFYQSLIILYNSYNTVRFNDYIEIYAACMLILVIGLLVMARYKYAIINKQNINEKLHGSARWATIKDIENAGLLSSHGVIVGAYQHRRKLKYLIHDGPEHVLTYAPTRSGKGVGLIVPTLTTWQHSVVATDIKGELWSMTSGYRQKYFDNLVMRFEPACKKSVKWNPFDEIRINTDYEVADAQSIAILIVDPNGKGLESHWDKKAYAIVTGCILYLLEQKINAAKDNIKKEANMSELCKLLSNPERPLSMLWQDMIKSSKPAVRTVGQDMIDVPEDEGGSIISTAKNELFIYTDPILANNTSDSDFSVKDLMNHDKPVSLYIVTQPSDIQRITPVFRLLINMIMRKNVTDFTFEREEVKEYNQYERVLKTIQGKPTEQFATIKGKGDYKHRLLMMLDEFPSLGKMDIIQTSLAYCAGYGIKCYLITQDLTQLMDKYGKNEAITSNCHIQNAYSPNKVETAEYLSKQTGETTVIEKNISESDSGFLGKKTHSKSISYTKRPLLTPDECMRLRGPKKENGIITRAGEMLIFVAGFPAIKGIQPLYFKEPVWQARASIQEPEYSDIINKKCDNNNDNEEKNN